MWNLAVLFNTDNDWKESINILENKLNNLNKLEFKDETLEADFSKIEYFSRQLDKLFTYGLLRREEESSNRDIISTIDKIRLLYRLFNDKISAFNTLLSKKDQIIKIMEDSDELKVFIPFFKEKSKILNNRSNFDSEHLYQKISPRDSYVSWYGNFKNIGNFKIGTEYKVITEENVLNYLRVDDQYYRRKAYEAVEVFLKEQSNQASFFLNAHYQLKNYIAKQNGFDHAYDMYISDNIFHKINSDYFFQKSQVDLIIKLHKKILENKMNRNSLSSMSYSDVYYLKNGQKYRLSFREALDIIKSTFKTKSTLFYEALNTVIDENWIFSEKSSLKHLGQRSISCFEAHPFITVNWNNSFDNLFELVHEISGAISQWLASKNGMFLYSELSILKTEFMSFLGTMYLIDFLVTNTNDNSIKEIISDETDNFIRESLVVPFLYSIIEYNLYKKAKIRKLYNDDISNIWYEFVSQFNDIKNFEEMPINRYNWVRHEHFYLEGYDFNYVIAFTLAYNFHNQNKDIDVVVKQLLKGEQISDEQFFKEIFDSSLNYHELLHNCVDDIVGKFYEENFCL